jgi:hypothetical protein
MSSFVTIDYDFFTRHAMHKDVQFPDGNTMPGLLVYDWQMSETRAPAFEHAIWRNRAADFMRWGLDIEALTKPELSVVEFAQQVTGRMDIYSSPATWRGDSHAWAGIVARDYANQFGPLFVVNFDAHHDLGYGDKPLENFTNTGSLACDNWAVIGLHQGWIKNYTVIYPDWLGKWEWGKNIRRPHLKEFRNRIRITTWSDWLVSGKEISAVEVAYFCRSSSWVPPFHDQGFQDLCDEFGWVECLDCVYGQHGSPYDTCENREWDWQEIEAELKLLDEMIERLKGLQKSA